MFVYDISLFLGWFGSAVCALATFHYCYVVFVFIYFDLLSPLC